MKQIARRFCCLIALCLAVFAIESTAKPGAKPVRAVDFSELDKLVPAELKEKNTPGTVIAIVSGDQVVYQKAFGVANVETNAEMQPGNAFPSRLDYQNVHGRGAAHSSRNKTRSR